MLEDKRTGEFWNKMCDLKKHIYIENPLHDTKKKETLRLIREWGGDLKNKRILKTDLYEEALGSDYILFEIAEECGNAVGTDISSKIVERAKKRALKHNVDIDCVVDDVRKSSFPDNSFDLIISNSTLDHFPEVGKALREHFRILKPGGTLILILNNKSNPELLFGVALNKLVHFLFPEWPGIYLDNCYAVRGTSRQLEEIGFTVEKTDKIIPDFLGGIDSIFDAYSSVRLPGFIYQCRIIHKYLDYKMDLGKKLAKMHPLIKDVLSAFIALKAVKLNC